MTFHLMLVNIIIVRFRLGVAPFGKELLTRLVFSHFGFEGGTLVLIASVPGHCLSFICYYTICNFICLYHISYGG